MKCYWCVNGCGKSVRYIRYGSWKDKNKRFKCVRCNKLYAKSEVM